MALMSLWPLVKQGSVSRRTRLADWCLCLGLWASLLADTRFWAWLTGDAGRRYRATISATDVDNARQQLEEWLSETVTRCGGYDVAAALTLEVRAARLVAVRGGIAAGNASRPIPCGPMLIQWLGLQQEAGRMASGLLTSRDEQTRRAAMCFSQLGMVLTHLDRKAPEAALSCLAELWCADCRRHGGKPGQAPRICRGACPAFDALNPAYANVKAGRKRFLVDATTLTVEANLYVAERAISAAEPDIPTAGEHWRSAARLSGSADPILRHVQRVVLPRVRFLLRARRDDAIAVLQALPFGSATASDEVFGEAIRSLSQLLAARGVEFANRKPPDLTRAQADLRQSVKLNPASWLACRNLAVVLMNAAGLILTPHPGSAESSSAAALLAEAREHLTTFPGGGDSKEIDQLLGSVSEKLGNLWNAQAVQAYERGNHHAAMRAIDRALREKPGDSVFLNNRRVIQEAMRHRDVLSGLPVGNLGDLSELLKRVADGSGYGGDPHEEPYYPASGWRRAWRAVGRWAPTLIFLLICLVAGLTGHAGDFVIPPLWKLDDPKAPDDRV